MVTAEVSEETTRLEAFSDGIFAIAMTLLVLEIRLPEDLAPGTLGTALLHLWRSYLAFLTSFVTIGVMWVNHHRVFNLIKRTDQAILAFNLLLMLGVSFLPFPTLVVARHIQTPDAATAAMFFNGTFIGIAFAWGFLWRYVARRRHLLYEEADHASIHGISRQYLLGPVYYIVAFIVAIFSPLTSVIIDLLLAIFFALPARMFHRGGNS
ncbi:MAG TPA: TMEM175 family protein [Thermoanaerobaculia bacterium]|nr:TMEM175 family protein [Thermoanaerobaculia bacterium]